MNARNRIFILLGLLFLFSLGWYFFTVESIGRFAIDRHSGRE